MDLAGYVINAVLVEGRRTWIRLVVRSGGLSGAAAGPLLFAIVGAVGFVGLLTGDAVSRYGLGRVCRGR